MYRILSLLFYKKCQDEKTIPEKQRNGYWLSLWEHYKFYRVFRMSVILDDSDVPFLLDLFPQNN